MAASNKENDDSELFQKVFSEGPLEELVTRCDVITAASLVGSSKLFFDSANDSATLSFSLPFGLPCVLHSHPTKVARDCKLTPLDRFSSDAVMPDGTGKQWVGANGDWVAMVDTGFPACKWKLVNVYTRREIPLPVPFETTHIPNIYHHNLRAIIFHKIYICQVPTAAGGYKNFSLVAVFDIRVALLCGEDSGWTVLTEPKSHIFYNYSDAILHNGLVFATTHTGTVHAWNPQQAGPPLIVEPPPIVFEWRCALDDALGHDHEVDYGMWWLARSIDGSRLLLIHTLGIADEREYSCKVCHTASDRRVHHGRTVGNYASGFGCLVFTKDTSKLNEGIPWEKIDDLGEYSLFLGVNYPIMLPLGGADVVPGCLTRRNCVYTLPNEAWLRNSQLPEICRFSLNREDCAVGFQTNALEKTCKTKKDRYLVKTPLWFIPNFANAPDWNKCDV